MRLATLLLLLSSSSLAAQDSESLRARIQDHYSAIHGQQTDAVMSHHLPDMTLFPQTGHVLMEVGWADSDARMGAELPFPEANVAMRDFNAQIYGDVGVATFYLDGWYGDERGTWRVSAVWVWRDGEWMEAHHHESRLVS